MAEILVTGGAGFIGSHMVERLLAEGRRVTVLDNFDTFYDPAIKRRNLAGAAKSPGLNLVEGDIRDRELVLRLFAERKFERVFHAAARAGVRPSVADPALYQSVNVEGTVSLLEAVRRHPVANFVFASSSSVYGANEKVPFSEDDAVERPISPYAATKRAGELICYTYHHLFKIPITCLRFFTVYGPRQRPEMAIHAFVRGIEAGAPVPVYGDGGAQRDFTYIDDIIDGVHRALFTPLGYEIINLGESRTIALRDLIGIIERALGKQANIRRYSSEPGDVPITFANVDRARRLLGYRPGTSVEAGVQRFVEWFRAREGMEERA